MSIEGNKQKWAQYFYFTFLIYFESLLNKFIKMDQAVWQPELDKNSFYYFHVVVSYSIPFGFKSDNSCLNNLASS